METALKLKWGCFRNSLVRFLGTINGVVQKGKALQALRDTMLNQDNSYVHENYCIGSWLYTYIGLDGDYIVSDGYICFRICRGLGNHG